MKAIPFEGLQDVLDVRGRGEDVGEPVGQGDPHDAEDGPRQRESQSRATDLGARLRAELRGAYVVRTLGGVVDHASSIGRGSGTLTS
jgi:hypothetical protein